MNPSDRRVAYFSMEIAFASEVPNYAGGLGVLAADTLLSAADLGTPLVGVSLIYHRNDSADSAFGPSFYMRKRDETVTVEIEGRTVRIVIWQYNMVGAHGHIIPVLFLSSHHPDNAEWDRDLTKHLYAPDRYTRLGQEVILGIGGVRALSALGYSEIDHFQINEGHAAFATLELLRRENYEDARVRNLCHFTTHTPIPAGHDTFDYTLAYQVLGDMLPWHIKAIAGEEVLNMTTLAMSLSNTTNSVSRRHREVCEGMFPGHEIQNVTNGVYHPRWAGTDIYPLLDEHLVGWRDNPELFREAPTRIPSEALRAAHRRQEEALMNWINRHEHFFLFGNLEQGDRFDADVITLGFARRFVPYKRPDLLFRNIERLASIAEKKIQIVFANRCHIGDGFCNDMRERILGYGETLRGKVNVVIIPDYSLDIGMRMITGCDIWLNTPVPPKEASGTSGMKAALNGGVNLSIRDGWWIEGLEHEPLAGFGVGGEVYSSPEEQDERDSEALLDALAEAVDTYYHRSDEWSERMKHSLALLSHFNTHRVVREYSQNIWHLGT